MICYALMINDSRYFDYHSSLYKFDIKSQSRERWRRSSFIFLIRSIATKKIEYPVLIMHDDYSFTSRTLPEYNRLM